MAEIMASPKFYQALVELTAQAAYKDLLAVKSPAVSEEQILPAVLRNWLGRLRLLYGVPFAYLVPHEKLLPPESVRFFYIDRNWTDRLMDGALSVGKTSTRDYAHHHAMQEVLVSGADDEERCIRRQLRDPSYQPAATAPGGDLTGMLVRSAVVSGWPGLEVKAYKGQPLGRPSEDQYRLQLLRMDRLAPDLLFCLWNDIPTRVEIIEPREGIRFGVDKYVAEKQPDIEPADCPSGWSVKLRYVQGNDAGWNRGHMEVDPPGTTVVNVPVPVRRADPSVVHVKNLAAKLKATLDQHPQDMPYDPSGAGEFSAAHLAVEMLQFPYIQIYEGATRPASEKKPAWTLQTAYAAASVSIGRLVEPLSEAEMVKLFGKNIGGGG